MEIIQDVGVRLSTRRAIICFGAVFALQVTIATASAATPPSSSSPPPDDLSSAGLKAVSIGSADCVYLASLKAQKPLVQKRKDGTFVFAHGKYPKSCPKILEVNGSKATVRRFSAFHVKGRSYYGFTNRGSVTRIRKHYPRGRYDVREFDFKYFKPGTPSQPF